MAITNLDLGLEYTGGIRKPTADQNNYVALVDGPNLNLKYVPQSELAGGGGGGSGDVNGPATSVTGNIAIWGDTTGELLDDSGQSIAGLTAAIVALIPAAGAAPANVTKAAAAAGVSTAYARQDHKHDITTAVAVSAAFGGTNTEGTSTSLARADHTHALPTQILFMNMPSVATDTLVGRDSAGTGTPQAITVGGGIEFTGGNSIQVSSQLPVRGTENVVVDLMPSATAQGTLATASSVNFDVPIAAGRRYEIKADVWVDDGTGTGACLFTKAFLIVAHQTGGAAVKHLEQIIYNDAGAGFTFTCAASTTNIRFTLTNSSGTTRSYNYASGAYILDKP